MTELEMVQISQEEYLSILDKIRSDGIITRAESFGETNPGTLCYYAQEELVLRILLFANSLWDYLFIETYPPTTEFHIREDLYERYCK